MSDLRTLKLTTPPLTEAALNAFVKYQRVLLAELAQAQAPTWAGRFAFAHSRALAESKLGVLEQQQLKSLVSDFCGKRSAALQVRQRLARAQHQVVVAEAAGKPADEKDQAVVARVAQELPKLEDFTAFAERYGDEALALIKGRELELVSLHQDLARLEGASGHVHPAASPPLGS